MTLPASFPISASQINVELGRAANAPFDIQGTEERTLAGVPAGAISFSDFLGKSNQSASFIGTTTLGGGTNPSSSVNIGAADANRRVVVVAHWAELNFHRTLNSATIGGISATIHQNIGHNGGTTGLGVAILSAIVPTGTTATVTLNFSGTVSDSSVGVWRLFNYNTIVDGGTDQTTINTGPVSVTVSTVSNGFVIAGYTGSTNTAGFNTSWTNATERYDASHTTQHSGADAAVNSGSLNVGATQGVINNAGNDLAVVSFGV